MKELLFISGFLGAGKTTFLKNFIRENRKKKLHIIVNEFGKIGVDSNLLDELTIELHEISNGSVLCSCKVDKFIEKLQYATQSNCDLIIVEASGFTDPTNFRNVISNLNIGNEISYLGDICIVDATRFLKLYQTAVVIEKQINSADVILINKCDKVSTKQIEDIKTCIYRNNNNAEIYEGSFGKFEGIYFNDRRITINKDNKNSNFQTADLTLRKYIITITKDTNLNEVIEFINSFLEETDRLKGFISCNNTIYYMDCVGNELKYELYTDTFDESILNKLVVLGSHGLKTKSQIKSALKNYKFASLE